MFARCRWIAFVYREEILKCSALHAEWRREWLRQFISMPSWESIWIPGVVVANVLGIAIVIYSWEHAYGLLSSFKKKNKAAKLSDDAEFLDDAPEFKAREKKKKPKAKGKTTGPNQVRNLSLLVNALICWKHLVRSKALPLAFLSVMCQSS